MEREPRGQVHGFANHEHVTWAVTKFKGSLILTA